MRKLSLYIDSSLEGRQVKSLLMNELGLSAGLIRRVKMREKGICLNKERVFTPARVCAGDTLEVEIGDDTNAYRPEAMAYPLDILFEDEDILIVNKPANMAIHQTAHCPGELTLENALSAYLPENEIPHPVSRLDKGTTGVITFAKNGYMHDRLRRIMHSPLFRREYRGIAVGTVAQKHGFIDLPIGFAEASIYKRAVCEGGQASQSEYELLEQKNGLSLLRLVPHTGRTHQLRVHMAAIGYPLFGDWLYGEEDSRISRPALHSYELWLEHPLSGERLHITAPLPEDFRALFGE